VGLRVEDRGRAVGLDERGRQVLAGDALDLREDLLGGVHVEVGVGAGAEDLVAAEHLEEVELDVAQVALVVAHCSTFSRSGSMWPRVVTGVFYRPVT